MSSSNKKYTFMKFTTYCTDNLKTYVAVSTYLQIIKPNMDTFISIHIILILGINDIFNKIFHVTEKTVTITTTMNIQPTIMVNFKIRNKCLPNIKK